MAAYPAGCLCLFHWSTVCLLHVPIVKHCRHLLHLFGVMCLISGTFYLLGFPQLLGFTSLIKPICSFAVAKVCILLSIWMTFWPSFALSGQVGVHACFVFLVGLSWSIHHFSKSDLCLSLSLLFWGCVGILSTCWYLYLLISWLTFSS